MAHQLTPMMKQYFTIKDKYPDCLIMYRLGDFYEMFFDDAKIASQILNLVLTGRDCGLEERAPMCGVPHHAVESYINKLIAHNYKVAICEQLEEASQAKGMVKRGVTRVITPGTITDMSMLSEGENNYILSVCKNGDVLGLSYCDVSTGIFYIYECPFSHSDLINQLTRIRPREILIPDSFLFEYKSIIKASKLKDDYVNTYFDWAYEENAAKKALLEHFNVQNFKGFGCEEYVSALMAGGALISYLHETQMNSLDHISRIRVFDQKKNMMLDATAIRNLELTQTIIDGSKKGSLLWLLDKTKTSLGARMLKQTVENPLRDIAEIQGRLDAVAEFKNNFDLLNSVIDCLKNIYDLERLISKISYGSLNAKDCLALKVSASMLPDMKSLLKKCDSALIRSIEESIDDLADLCILIENSIKNEAGLSIRDGGIIKDGFDAEVDELRKASNSGKNWLAELEARERELTGIPKLKISYNKVFGYYIEVTNSYKEKVPYRYIAKQTLVNSERYITEELKKMEDTILNSHERLCAKEYSIFLDIRNKLSGSIARIQKTASAIAFIDVLQSLAKVAYDNGYVMPKMSTNGKLQIKNGRHPVVEKMSNSFVPNDVVLDHSKNNLLLITGPNMAGKSTYMRQVGIIVLMAHIGSFVPADSANITLVDRIFTRVGASDDLSSGQSTFMVEMNELANILNNATKDSLLILDEIGRGTSTIDGLSIAWATVEYLTKNIGAKTMFATHYHELIELENVYDGIKNCSIAVKQFGNEIIFLHKIIPSGTDKSFGVEVARLAGLPASVIEKARELLKKFQAQELSLPREENVMQQDADDEKCKNVANKIKKIDINTLTPLEALNIICELQKEL